MKKRLPHIFTALFSTALKAQEDIRVSQIRISSDESRWFASPWIWIGGAAVLITLLVIMTKDKREGEK